MRRNDKKKKKYFIIIFFIALITFLICFLLFFSPHSKTSDFYQSVIDYQDGYPLAPKENTAYSNSSGEALFFQAMASYEAEDYDSAISLFQNALKIKSDDPALRCFLLYYLNQSLFYRDGIGNRETISAAVDSISLYQPLVDRTDMLFNLFDTICFTKEDARFAVDLLYSYIQKTKNCTLDTKIFLKNYMGMTEYSHQEYSKSLRLFYDVELSLQNNATTPELMTELRFAKEYIANIYYLFEDYEKAAVLYEEVINLSLENNISFEYNSCINLANCFLENNHITKAKESIALLERVSNRKPDVKVHIDVDLEDYYRIKDAHKKNNSE